MYDAIIVGARCAGSPTAMLLARKGYRVLLLDRATFPSDTISTHIIWYGGISHLKRWGLLDRVLETGCPPLTSWALDIGDFRLAAQLPPVDAVVATAPRRIILDPLLAQAAVEAGAELREGFVVDEYLSDGERITGIRGRTAQGTVVTEQARIVIGADGKHSRLAQTVSAPVYQDQPTQAFYYYSYWSGCPLEGVEGFWRPRRFILAIPTHHHQTEVVVGGNIADFKEFRGDIESNFMKILDMVPWFAERVRSGRREEEFRAMADLPNFYRKPFGPGWALVGDAGLHEDPLLGHGISNAFRDAQLLADAVDAGFSGVRPLEEALADYEAQRNQASMAAYERNWRTARLENWDRPEHLRVRAAIRDNPAEASQYIGTYAQIVPNEAFWAEENIMRILGAAEAG